MSVFNKIKNMTYERRIAAKEEGRDTSLLKAGSDVLGKWRKKAKERGSLCDRFKKKECHFIIFL